MPELTLLHPERLWWLLLLPVLFWLLLPPRPRRTAYTAHLSQWHEALRGLRRRPRRAVSLRGVLLLLAAGCALLAALGLALAGRSGPGRLVVLLDGSASMAAHDAFAAAERTLRQGLAALPESVDVRLLRCGGPLLRRSGRSARELHDLGQPAGAREVDLSALAAAVADDGWAAEDNDSGGDAGTVVWTLTDGQGPGDLPSVGALSLFGARGVNAAVLAVRTVDHWPLPELQLEADVVAFAGAAAASVEIAVSGAVDAVAPQVLLLPPGERTTVRFALVRAAVGGELAVSVELAGDALAADDRWSLLLPPLPAPRIAVLTDAEAGPFADVAAAALAAEVRGTVVPASAGAEIGLLLVDGGEVGLLPGTARALCFGARFGGGDPAGPPEPAGALDWDRGAALCAGLDLAELRVDAVYPATLPAGEPFLFGQRGGERVPLAVVAGDRERASVHFAFRLQDSNLPLLAAFPQLLRRAFVRCHGDAARLLVTTAAPAVGEQDLWTRQQAPERPLPEFATLPVALGAWLMLAGAALLILRGLCR